MPPKLTKTIIGAIIAVALAAAVSYGVISQQTADQIQTKANQSLQTDQTAPAPAPQQTQPLPQDPTPQAPGEPKPAPQAPASRP
ncbi:hypothetical protein WYO_4872 [Methylobacterium sp. GXF4]|jgi:hypothetical protein|uniref:Uncharacterized protein n=1 Tax=Methylobacterium brachiatum TaxID=269660 RepID=A0AAJ1WZ37_9HYPH|nr:MULTISPECIES: hypothetical protein [Methylobacterium]EIZ82518.1 hypothetical protein WYO_4872 [Methylobacterium sp. GXF4]MCB4806096.1 hypothetical protein [Methylobacterium brachiatum]MDQ0544948.1 hypothetical protein [Methylobacterium brachiatum]